MGKLTMECLAALALVSGLTAEAADLVRKTTYLRDDYEDESIVRSGDPSYFKGIVSVGLLTDTNQGVYRTDDSVVLQSGTYAAPASEDEFLESGIRIYRQNESASLTASFRSAGLDVGLSIGRRGNDLVLSSVGKSMDVPVSALPADVSLAAAPDGRRRLRVRSLVDSAVRNLDLGTCAPWVGTNAVAVSWTLAAKGGAAELQVDEYFVGISKEDDGKTVPFEIERLPEFDPVKAGWKKVFEDEFDGDRVEWGTKWFLPHFMHDDISNASLDGEGHLKIKVDFRKGEKSYTNLWSTSLCTTKGYVYGYFEARVKFTEHYGFWSSFWAHGDSIINPFVDGLEIDGYEDYFLRVKDPKSEDFNILDHNLHIGNGLGRIKSYNYRIDLPGNREDWHTIGFRWTPFEISYYFDGKIEKCVRTSDHSPWETVTFDAFHHAACTAPLHGILSCCIMRSPWWQQWSKDIGGYGCTDFPASFTIDRVRIYEYPDPGENGPSVKWAAKSLGPDWLVPTGGVIRLSADVAPSPKTGAKIKAAYLFDSGFFLQCRTEPPYDFEIPLTEEFYSTTAYARPGRQKTGFSLDGQPRVFHVFVQDENGKVARTSDCVVRLPYFGKSAPYQGCLQTIPGVVNPTRFDEGGVPIAYFQHAKTLKVPDYDFNERPSMSVRPDEHVSCSASGDALDFATTGQWMNHTVDIAEAGRYSVSFEYGTPSHGVAKLIFLVDGRHVATAELAERNEKGFARTHKATVAADLPAGRHVLTLLPMGPIAFGTLNFSH